MKKSRILGYALTLAATLAVGSAMGQTIPSTFTKVGTQTDEGSDFEHRSFVTVNGTYGFYVTPDALFNPDFATNGNVKSTWLWQIPANVTSNGTAPVAPETRYSTATNYVTLKPTTTGVKTVSVWEQAAAAFGGCLTPSSRSFDLVVLPEPTFSFAANQGVAVTSTASCGTIADKTITINMTALESFNIKFSLNVKPVTIKADGTLDESAAGTTTSFSYSKIKAGSGDQTAQGGDVWNLDGTALTTKEQYDAVADNQTLIFKCKRNFNAPASTDAFPIYKYTYSVADDGSQGISDFVTRRAQYDQATGVLAGTTVEKLYATAGTIEIYVKKAPKTGPVYHISNNIAK